MEEARKWAPFWNLRKDIALWNLYPSKIHFIFLTSKTVKLINLCCYKPLIYNNVLEKSQKINIHVFSFYFYHKWKKLLLAFFNTMDIAVLCFISRHEIQEGWPHPSSRNESWLPKVNQHILTPLPQFRDWSYCRAKAYISCFISGDW